MREDRSKESKVQAAMRRRENVGSMRREEGDGCRQEDLGLEEGGDEWVGWVSDGLILDDNDWKDDEDDEVDEVDDEVDSELSEGDEGM
jgi:hypothetical protein